MSKGLKGFQKGHSDFVPKRARVEAGKKLRGRKLGRSWDPTVKEKLRLVNTGKHLLKETKEKISMANKGRRTGLPLTFEHKMKLRKAHLGTKKPWVSEAMKKRTGEIAQNWHGGISFEPYSIDWTKTLKRSIRERDHYICRVCDCYGNFVHHIDYDKQNCDPQNLVTLCNRCHARTNAKRALWRDFFERNTK